MTVPKIPAELEYRFSTAVRQLAASRKEADVSYPQWARGVARNLRAVADLYDEARRHVDAPNIIWHALVDAAARHRRGAEDWDNRAQRQEERAAAEGNAEPTRRPVIEVHLPEPEAADA